MYKEKYERPKYGQPGAATEERKMMFSSETVLMPKLDYPISVRENFRRAAWRDNPMWIPNATTDMDTLMGDIPGNTFGTEGMISSDTSFTYKDKFGVDWTYVPVAGGSMLTPGTQFMDDITEWESKVKFPEMTVEEWRPAAEAYNARRDPEKVLNFNIGQGCTERLVALLGGYTDGMVALAMEPEAVKDFFYRFVEYMISMVDAACELYPVDMISYHDDWGTERDTFFSPAMMEDIVFDPTKVLFDHIKSKGLVLQLHSCGKIERFVPYMIDLGVDFMQIQRRANDIPMLKEKYGDKIGFNTGVEGLPTDREPTEEDVIEAVRHSVELYGKGGGIYTSVFVQDPALAWTGVEELFWYSREYYEREQGR